MPFPTGPYISHHEPPTPPPGPSPIPPQQQQQQTFLPHTLALLLTVYLLGPSLLSVTLITSLVIIITLCFAYHHDPATAASQKMKSPKEARAWAQGYGRGFRDGKKGVAGESERRLGGEAGTVAWGMGTDHLVESVRPRKRGNERAGICGPADWR